MSTASLIGVIVLGVAGWQKVNNFQDSVATKDDLTGAIAVHAAVQHRLTENELAELAGKTDILLEESLRSQIVTYTEKICMEPDHPQADAWRSELARLLATYETEIGRAFPAELLECR